MTYRLLLAVTLVLISSGQTQANTFCQPRVVTASKKYDLGSDPGGRWNLPFPGNAEGSLGVLAYYENDRRLLIQGHSLMNIEYIPASVPAGSGHLCKFGMQYELGMGAQGSSCVFLPIDGDTYVIASWDLVRPASDSEDQKAHVVLTLESTKFEQPASAGGEGRCHASTSVEPYLKSFAGKAGSRSAVN